MNDEPNWKKSLPFPTHWLWYLAMKIAILALALFVALKYYGLV